MLACLVMALAGFLTFGDETEGNVLNNFPEDNVLVNIARLCVSRPSLIPCCLTPGPRVYPLSQAPANLPPSRSCFGLNMLTTLPLEAFVCREVLLTYFHGTAAHSAPRHVLYTAALVLAATLLALLTSDLGAVFELVGAVSACPLAYILPPLCFLKLRRWRWDRPTAAAAACVAFGVAVLVVSVVLSVRKMAGGDGETADGAQPE